MRKVQVDYHREDGTWWADSPDIDGLVVVGAHLDEARQLVHDGIGFYLEGEPVTLIERTDDGAALDVASAVAVRRTSWWTAVESVGFGFGGAHGGQGVRVSSAPTPALT